MRAAFGTGRGRAWEISRSDGDIRAVAPSVRNQEALDRGGPPGIAFASVENMQPFSPDFHLLARTTGLDNGELPRLHMQAAPLVAERRIDHRRISCGAGTGASATSEVRRCSDRARPRSGKHVTRKVLLACGILSALLYAFMNVFVPLQDPNYRFASQTVSELSAVGAPTRALWGRFGIVYSVLFFGTRFRIYSIASLVALIVCGVLTGIESPRIAANLPTPSVGIWERLNIATFFLWVIALAVTLLRRRSSPLT
jgi:hypothetical protein